MLELNQILKANEINFAILAALPAFAVIVLSMILVRSWIMQVSYSSHLLLFIWHPWFSLLAFKLLMIDLMISRIKLIIHPLVLYE